jgi:CRP/FNR family transcriptional regulator
MSQEDSRQMASASTECVLEKKDAAQHSDCVDCPVQSISFCRESDISRLPVRRQQLILQDRETIGCARGTPAELLNFVSGLVKLVGTLPDGRTQILGFRGPGDFLIIGEDGKQAISVEAVGAVRLCRFSWPRLKQLLQERPQALALLLGKSQEQLEELQEHLLVLGRKSAREKVASFLVRYGLTRRGAHGQPPPRAQLLLTRAELADFLGLTTETVSRVLTQFVKEGLVSIGRAQAIYVLDWEQLRSQTGN